MHCRAFDALRNLSQKYNVTNLSKKMHCRAFDADKDDRLSFKEWQVGFYLLILLPKVADRDEDVNGGGNDDDEDVNGDSNDDDEDVDGDRDQDVDGDSSDVYRHRCHTLPILHLMIL